MGGCGCGSRNGPLSTHCLCTKYFLQIILFGKIKAELSIMLTYEIPCIVAYETVQYNFKIHA